MKIITTKTSKKKPKRKTRQKRNPKVPPRDVHKFVESLIDGNFHAQQVLSLSNGVVGVLHSASLGIAALGQGLAVAKGLIPKHATKQIDRLLSNKKIDDERLMSLWVSHVVAEREEIVVILDWTEFAADKQSTLAAYLMTSHGRATPLLWKTHESSKLKHNRCQYEDDLLDQLWHLVPETMRVTIVADRGFADQSLYKTIQECFGWDYLTRFNKSTKVTDSKGVCKSANDWLSKSGRAKRMENVFITADLAPVPVAIHVKAKKMKNAWHLVSSRQDLKTTQLTKMYGKRFTIEETFRDMKNEHMGLGLSSRRIKNPKRRDRLLFMASLAHALLTLLGQASEATGFDRALKTNTAKKRTHSLFRQGVMLFQLLPNMQDRYAKEILLEFGRILQEQPLTSELYSFI